MRTLATLPMLLFALVLTAQCKYSQNEEDLFTGELKQVTYWQTISAQKTKDADGMNKNLSFRLVRNGEFKFLEAYVQVRDVNRPSLCFGSDSYMMFKLDNSEIIKIPYVGDYECDYTNDNSEIKISGHFSLNDLNYQLLSESCIDAIRIGFDDTYIDNKLEDRPVSYYNAAFSPRGKNKYVGKNYFKDHLACVQ